MALEQVKFFVEALTGNAETVMDWRCVHDTRKDVPPHNYRGTADQCFKILEDYNSRGYGIFAAVNAFTGDPKQKKTLENVAYIRAHFVDLDNQLTAATDLDRAAAFEASFAISSSPGKYHAYWRMEPYTGNDFFKVHQQKLLQLFSGDPSVCDATRVMRVPGFYHLKATPHYVCGWKLPHYDKTHSAAELQARLAQVHAYYVENARSPLGTPELAAPSLDWLRFALTLINPNDLSYHEWMVFTHAFKQAGWTLAEPETLYSIWMEWCAQYAQDDTPARVKLWNSISETETGWKTIERMTPVKAYMMFGFKDAPKIETDAGAALQAQAQQNDAGGFGEILSEADCRKYFADCFFVERMGKIFSKSARFMNSTQFNGRYGGKQFIITSTGKLCAEPWTAALNSTLWTIPKVDHIRFLPDQRPFEIIEDALGRPGLNTYIPAKVKRVPGDVSLWLSHLARIFPNENDRKIFTDYLAHNVKYPGYKIPWAPMLQSAEGVGKTVFFEVIQYCLGDMYVYTPKASELVKSGSVFNSWQRGKLMIIVNEIKVDERRELVEVLKPHITDARVEVQSKGVDQDMEDNPANWLFFSNHKDAIPITMNGRRYAIFYAALQTSRDIVAAGMGDDYFTGLFNWLRHGGGLQAIAYWFDQYPITKGALPVRAPETSSHAEALRKSRSPLELIIAESIEDALPGFRGGYISSVAVMNRAKAAGLRSVNTHTVAHCAETLGYVGLGRAVRPYMQEDAMNRAELFGIMSALRIEDYGRAQGYE